LLPSIFSLAGDGVGDFGGGCWACSLEEFFLDSSYKEQRKDYLNCQEVEENGKVRKRKWSLPHRHFFSELGASSSAGVVLS
jgi:hypothetical protein